LSVEARHKPKLGLKISFTFKKTKTKLNLIIKALYLGHTCNNYFFFVISLMQIDLARRFLLNWGKRADIIERITQGLLYLQEYSRLTIIYRDLKASNVLLDSEIKPKISNFSMAKIHER
jgi:serine/threonine protein kinase